MIGYSNSGRTYNISSERGLGFINDAPLGSQLVGGDSSVWTKNSDGSVTINQNGTEFNVANSMGSLTNALAAITGISDKTSARSNQYAQENREWSANQAAIANELNIAEAARNRDWQEYMSNTAHQREVADLKAAGLNPVLSASGGNGAAVTSGATASANMPSGSQGQADTSANAALVSILGSMLSAQTSLANSALSARTQEAVADKYTAMSQITSNIAAAASMSNAALAAEANRYGTDMQYTIKQDFPDSMYQVVDNILHGMGLSYSDIGSAIKTGLQNINNVGYIKTPLGSKVYQALQKFKNKLGYSSYVKFDTSAASGRKY